MSVCVVHTPLLCESCKRLGFGESDENTGGERQVVEVNDLCSPCAQRPHLYAYGLPNDHPWSYRIREASPWHKAEREALEQS